MVVAASLFATLSVVSRNAAALGLGTVAFVTWRSILAAVVLWGGTGVTRAVGRGRALDLRSISSRARVALGVATLTTTAVNLAIFGAFQRIPVALALIIFYAYPAVVTLGAVAFLGDRLAARRVGALVLALGGLVLVVLAPALEGGAVHVEPLGIVLALVAASAQAVFVLVSARGYVEVPYVHSVALMQTGSVVVTTALLAASGAFAELARPFAEPLLWPWILAAATTGAAIPATALLIGIQNIGPSRAAILMTLEPVVAATLAALFLDESPTLVQVIGGAAVLGAGVLLESSTDDAAAGVERGGILEPA